MNKNKIACVVQRYGTEVNGGSEYLCRELSEHLLSQYEVEVLTSCALVYLPWDNYYPEGVETINGVTVRRFPIEKERSAAFAILTERMRNGDKSVEDEWIEECGPYCPSLITYLKEHSCEYKAVIFFTYTYYLTVEGLKLGLKNSILMPTAHDEPIIYLSIYSDLFLKPRAILYNTVEEKEFLIDKFGTKEMRSRLGCAGIVIPEEREYKLPARLEEYKDNYIVYVGRVSSGKNYELLNRYFIEYKKRNPSQLKLIIVGRTDENMSLCHSEDIIYAGFVSEEEKTAIMQHAKLLVMPSLYESLSLVILESMAVKRPVLVNGNCAVLKGQCIRSNAGLYYSDYFEFEAALNYILSNKEAYTQMCENGFRFVKENYDWKVIVDNVSSLIEEIQK